MFKEQTKKEKIMLSIAVLFMVIGFANSIRVLFMDTLNVPSILTVIEYVLIIVYATILYKKPHGNLLKSLIMIFAFIVSYFAISAYSSDDLSSSLSSVIVVLAAFMAGRLVRYKQNVIIASIVLVMLLITGSKDMIQMNNLSEEERQIGQIPETSEVMEMPMEQDDKKPFEEETPSLLGNVMSCISYFNMSIMWTAIFFGYCSRYRQHKEAGLIDK